MIQCKIKSILRGYTYVATISGTGELMHIEAGCRHWGDFYTARKHYREHRDWTDDAVAKATSIFHKNEAQRRWAFRFEARRILDALETRVQRLQKAIRTRRKTLRANARKRSR